MLTANAHIMKRLSGIQAMLVGAHGAGRPMSSASKGKERETFIEAFLSQVLPPQYRFGTGDAIDQSGQRSGQLDVVVEYPLGPSLPIVGSSNPRLYLAEGIAAAIEVKSDVAGQWGEVLETSARLAPLRRRYASGITMGPGARDRIPLFAIGYTGWSTREAVARNLGGTSIDGILVIDSGVFVSNGDFHGIACEGNPIALWALIVCVHTSASVVTSTGRGVPVRYLV